MKLGSFQQLRRRVPLLDGGGIVDARGFLRGLAFHNGHAIVGVSLPRDGSFIGLALDQEQARDAEP